MVWYCFCKKRKKINETKSKRHKTNVGKQIKEQMSNETRKSWMMIQARKKLGMRDLMVVFAYCFLSTSFSHISKRWWYKMPLKAVKVRNNKGPWCPRNRKAMNTPGRFSSAETKVEERSVSIYWTYLSSLSERFLWSKPTLIRKAMYRTWIARFGRRWIEGGEMKINDGWKTETISCMDSEYVLGK